MAERRVAVVTGANRGIGLEICRQLARRGDIRVVLTSRDPAKGREAAGRLAQEGLEVDCHRLDVTEAKSVAALVAFLEARHGRADILVNNAGVLRPRMVWNLPPEDWDAVVAVHLRGAYSMIHHAAGPMREARRGRIVNMGSEAWRGTVGQANYGAAKGGVFSLTRAVARELGRYGITCNTVCPAAATRLTLDEAVKEGFRKRLAAGLITRARFEQVMNMGGPEHVAPFVTWLVSEAGAQVNGQAFRVEQGLIGIYNEPELRASLARADGGLFGLEELDQLVPRTLLGGYVNPAPAEAAP